MEDINPDRNCFGREQVYAGAQHTSTIFDHCQWGTDTRAELGAACLSDCLEAASSSSMISHSYVSFISCSTRAWVVWALQTRKVMSAANHHFTLYFPEGGFLSRITLFQGNKAKKGWNIISALVGKLILHVIALLT